MDDSEPKPYRSKLPKWRLLFTFFFVIISMLILILHILRLEAPAEPERIICTPSLYRCALVVDEKKHLPNGEYIRRFLISEGNGDFIAAQVLLETSKSFDLWNFLNKRTVYELDVENLPAQYQRVMLKAPFLTESLHIEGPSGFDVENALFVGFSTRLIARRLRAVARHVVIDEILIDESDVINFWFGASQWNTFRSLTAGVKYNAIFVDACSSIFLGVITINVNGATRFLLRRSFKQTMKVLSESSVICYASSAEDYNELNEVIVCGKQFDSEKQLRDLMKLNMNTVEAKLNFSPLICQKCQMWTPSYYSSGKIN